MGVGGALMWPAILGMTFAALPAEKAGLAGGLIRRCRRRKRRRAADRGVLDDIASWRWIFYLNLPVTAFAVAVTTKFIHQPRTQTEDTQLDYWGVVTITVGLVALLLALDQVPEAVGDLHPRADGAVLDLIVTIGAARRARAGAAGRSYATVVLLPARGPFISLFFAMMPTCRSTAVKRSPDPSALDAADDGLFATSPFIAGLCTTASDRSCSPRSARPASPPACC